MAIIFDKPVEPIRSITVQIGQHNISRSTSGSWTADEACEIAIEMAKALTA